MPADAASEPGPPPLAAARPESPSASSVASGNLPALDLEYDAKVPLGLADAAVIDNGAAAQHPALTAGRKRYLCYFLHRHLEFRLPEITSLAEALLGDRSNGESSIGSSSDSSGGTEALPAAPPAVVWERPFGNRTESPFWYAHLPGGDSLAAEVARRSMLCKAMLEVWAEAATLEDLRAAIAAYPAAEKEQWGGPEQSFKVVVETWGTTWTMAQQIELIDSLEHCTGFKGPINLRNPSQRFWIIAAQSSGRGLPPLPHRFYFGRQVGVGDRAPLVTYDLRRRRYLGPTSMDTEMAFLMCHMAKVRRCSLVLDPFVGTGSILVPAAHLGALTLGWDIDVRVIKLGKKDKAGRPVNVWTNFADYSLPAPLGLLRCDLHTAPLRPGLEGVLDAIVCDPPYGVRAGGRKSVPKEREIRNRDTYVPSTDPYTVAECLHDLLEAAARLLVRGGRLAYFLPAAPGYYFEEELPRHPALEFVANCEQLLTTRYSRRLIVMEKVRRYDAAAAAAYFEQRGPPRMSVDDMHEYVYKTPAQLAAEAGLSLEEHRAAQAARLPRHRGKNI